MCRIIICTASKRLCDRNGACPIFGKKKLFDARRIGRKLLQPLPHSVGNNAQPFSRRRFGGGLNHTVLQQPDTVSVDIDDAPSGVGQTGINADNAH